jgi:hypothetical protein
MDLATIKDWLVPISTFITLITASIGGWLSLREFIESPRRNAACSEFRT